MIDKEKFEKKAEEISKGNFYVKEGFEIGADWAEQEMQKEVEQLKYNLKCRDDELAESRAHITTLKQDLKNMTKRCKDYELATCKGCIYLELEPDNEHCNHCYAGSRKNVL